MASDPKKDITTGILVLITALIAVGSILETGQGVIFKGLIAAVAAILSTRWLSRGVRELMAQRREIARREHE
jgi:hypothetical protein